jgi:4-amino-4-deoxy-L-arabinose transferase-like glycosyltransferase
MVKRTTLVGLAVALLVVVLLFLLYINGLSKNPPGFYVDESGVAYNAYLIAHTGAGESGVRFPLFFQFYTGGFTQWANPTQIYLLSILFFFIKPSILAARIFSAAWVFAACLLLGFLAKQISGRKRIGIIVAAIALLTPWLFEVSRLVLETFFYPMAVVLFLLAVHYAQRKEKWEWPNVLAIAGTLALLTYTYSIGRLLGMLMAFGLVIFATNYERFIGVLKTWVAYVVTLVPLLIFNSNHPGVLTQRFYLISYIKPESTWREIIPMFTRRYLADFSLINLLIDGDGNPRHHVPGSLGSFLIGAFILIVIGLVVVIVRHWREPWWRFVIYGTLVSVIPGSLTGDQFHSLRMIAYPVFLLVLTIPALEFLLERLIAVRSKEDVARTLSQFARRTILAILLLASAIQAIYFQKVFRREGPKRDFYFDVDYKIVYDEALKQPNKPIYLLDGVNGPVYMDGLWYAAVEGRNRADFIHLDEGKRAPAGTIVISSEEICFNCQIIRKSGPYMVYRQF